LADLSRDIPRAIAMIDLIDLRWQLALIGGALGHDLTAVVQHLEAGLATVDPARPEAQSPDTRLSFGAIYVYAPLEPDRSREEERTPEAERMIFRRCGTDVNRDCSACTKPCTHCRGGAEDRGGRGHDSPIANDLLGLAREDAYDWAVVLSADTWLIPVVAYLQSHGRKIIHGCFPPIAMDLTKECWASIDLRALNRGLESPLRTSP
jgi:hypothetical protein